MSNKGRVYENQLARDVYRQSDGNVLGTTMGYSGNAAVPAADLLTMTADSVHGIEVKITDGTYLDIGADQLRQLTEIESVLSETSVLFRFARREPLLVSLKQSDMWGLSERIPDPFDPRVNGSETPLLRLTKPSLDEWSSAQSGETAVKKLITAHD